MRIAIVYDSIFGNTARLAWAMAEVLSAGNEVATCSLAQAGTIRLDALELLLVGSPTRGSHPTSAIEEFLSGLDRRKAGGVTAAAFDTRLDPDGGHLELLRWMAGAGGYAADRIATLLAHKGFVPGGSIGFVLAGSEGPLRDGEVERARAWARRLDRLPVAVPA